MFHPYQNESESVGIGDLTIENREDRIELYGSLNITRDKAGLMLALSLKELLDATVKTLKAGDLPDRIEERPTKTVANPFKGST